MILRQILRRPLSCSAQLRTMSTGLKKDIHFGPFEVTDQVFHQTSLCYALVNIKPILPGHVLVIPFRQVQRLTDLTPDEVGELFGTVQKVQRMLAKIYFSDSAPDLKGQGIEDGSFNIAIQDGKEAGQTVPHVHCHIIPRAKERDGGKGEGDGRRGGNVGGGLWDLSRRPEQIGKFPAIEDKDRFPRSNEDMQKEAAFFREQMALID
ncbi:HIT-like domain-containing protein [Bisporella sp. PMI_857]|nr:HIT-like domain-containing protein [Bisporella sp. PMI_857]